MYPASVAPAHTYSPPWRTVPDAARLAPLRGYQMLETTFGRAVTNDDCSDTVWCLQLRDRTPGRATGSELFVALAAQAVVGARACPEDRTDLDLDLFGAACHGVNRSHLLLEPTPDGLFVTDMGSLHGSWLDDCPLIAGRSLRLAAGKVLVVGGLHLEIAGITPVRLPQPASYSKLTSLTTARDRE